MFKSIFYYLLKINRHKVEMNRQRRSSPLSIFWVKKILLCLCLYYVYTMCQNLSFTPHKICILRALNMKVIYILKRISNYINYFSTYSLNFYIGAFFSSFCLRKKEGHFKKEQHLWLRIDSHIVKRRWIFKIWVEFEVLSIIKRGSWMIKVWMS